MEAKRCVEMPAANCPEGSITSQKNEILAGIRRVPSIYSTGISIVIISFEFTEQNDEEFL
jgi:hypothetical protein